MTRPTEAADAALEASVVGSFSRIGLWVRSRLLPEFTTGAPATLEGHTVVITGATSGIGHATATALARLGATVHFLARDRARAAGALRRIAAASGSQEVSCGLANLDDPGSARAFADDCLSTHEQLDVLIHNAGAIHSSYQTHDAGTGHGGLGSQFTAFFTSAVIRASASAVSSFSAK